MIVITRVFMLRLPYIATTMFVNTCYNDLQYGENNVRLGSLIFKRVPITRF